MMTMPGPLIQTFSLRLTCRHLLLTTLTTWRQLRRRWHLKARGWRSCASTLQRIWPLCHLPTQPTPPPLSPHLSAHPPHARLSTRFSLQQRKIRHRTPSTLCRGRRRRNQPPWVFLRRKAILFGASPFALWIGWTTSFRVCAAS